MANDSNKLYRTLWRWHFYAGIFCIPFVLSLSITGAIYLFKPQIEQWIDRDYQQLDITEQRGTPEQHISAAKDKFPESALISYRLPEHERQAIVITLNEKGQRILVYIHPYSLTILKTQAQEQQFIRIVRTLHGELLMGNVGSILIELAGCWAIVLIITGLYLWWPRQVSGFAGILWPRFSLCGRKFWREIHAVLGFWLSFFTLFLLVSGLPWALVWGSVFKEIRSMSTSPLKQNWSVSHAEHQAQPQTDIRLSVSIVNKATELNFAPPVEISPEKVPKLRWKVSSGHQNRMLRSDAWFNAKTGELLEFRSFSDRAAIDKTIGIGISAHEGHLFGWLNQLLGLAITLGLISVSVSGFILWRKRKPYGVLGAPPSSPNANIGRAVVIISFTLAMLLPVLAMSLIFVFLLEKCLLSKVPRFKLWLGLA